MNYAIGSKGNKFLLQFRAIATQLLPRNASKTAVEVDPTVLMRLENEELKPRHHTGKIIAKRPQLPAHISRALMRVIGDRPIKTLLEDCKRLNQYISARHPPVEHVEMREKLREIAAEVDEKIVPPPQDLHQLDDLRQLQYKRRREAAIRKLTGNRIYTWKPITYGEYEALVYAIGRGAQEYAILLRVMQEIQARDEEFKPRSYFDFGSGVGTGMWAASSLWKSSIFEYFNVDSSRDMHDLSDLIMREGNENQQSILRNVYYRQFLPGLETKYDLVVCSFSLFELPNESSRKEVLRNLWNKCDGYLIIAEEGTRRGSELINEARDYILSLEGNELKGHVFAPCAHDEPCPRLADPDDRTPCNFELSYVPNRQVNVSSSHYTARYSYVVMKKGEPIDRTRHWPRLVRPTLVRSRHAICRMCTAEGKLQEIIFTQSKHGKFAYRCAKVSRWGDRLPIAIDGEFDGSPNVNEEETNEELQITGEDLELHKS